MTQVTLFLNDKKKIPYYFFFSLCSSCDYSDDFCRSRLHFNVHFTLCPKTCWRYIRCPSPSVPSCHTPIPIPSTKTSTSTSEDVGIHRRRITNEDVVGGEFSSIKERSMNKNTTADQRKKVTYSLSSPRRLPWMPSPGHDLPDRMDVELTTPAISLVPVHRISTA